MLHQYPTPGSKVGSRDFTQRSALYNPNPRILPRQRHRTTLERPNAGILRVDRCHATLVRRQVVLREKDVSGRVELTVVHATEPNVAGVVP